MKTIFLIIALLFSVRVSAQELAPSSQPVEISAAKSLEWNRTAKTYIARGSVIVTQGAMKIESDSLTARYTDAEGMTDISTLEAEGHVVITSAPYTAYGERAVYNVKTGNAVMTGKELQIITDADILKADEKIEFFGSENKLVASGNATALHGTDTLSAPSLTAFFAKDAEGKLKADKITGAGGVTIKTGQETATGDSGVYDIPAKKAVLTGKVRVLQGKNWLEGTRADVDMVTGISRLSGKGNAATGGRVKGVFYPKTDQPQPESPAE